MPNTIVTPTQVLRESLRILHNSCAFLAGTNKEYSKQFAISGAKIGYSVQVRKPNRYFVSEQTALVAQDTTEETVTITLDTNFQVGLHFSQADLTVSLDDFSKRILKPAMSAMASKIDYRGLGRYVDVYNVVGTPGTTPGTSGTGSGMTLTTAPQVYLNAGAMLDMMAVPRDERSVSFSPLAQALSVGGLSGLYQDQKLLAKQYREGRLGYALGFDFNMDQNINSLTSGTRAGSHGTAGNFKVHGASQTVAAGGYLTCYWVSDANTASTIKAGEVIEIAGVYALNPENQQSTGQLAKFTITADVTMPAAGTDFNVYIDPPLIAGSSSVIGTVDAVPSDLAVIRLVNSVSATTAVASPVSPQNLAYHKDAFTFATADLQMPKGVDFAARESFDGVSMLVVRAYDINNQAFPCRADVLGGWKTTRPEMACRIVG
jgi:hypothetical protein